MACSGAGKMERYAAIGDGMHTGTGLSLCRTLVEKHGGRVKGAGQRFQALAAPR